MKLKNIAAVIMILCIAVSGCSPKPAQETTASEASKPVESPDGEPELKEYTITYLSLIHISYNFFAADSQG